MLTYTSFKTKSKATNEVPTYLTNNYNLDVHRKSNNQPHLLPKVSIIIYRNKRYTEKLIPKTIKLMFINMLNTVVRFLNLNLREVHLLSKRMCFSKMQVLPTNCALLVTLAKSKGLKNLAMSMKKLSRKLVLSSNGHLTLQINLQKNRNRK